MEATAGGEAAAFDLLALPDELIMCVLDHLDQSDLARLMRVSKRLHRIASSHRRASQSITLLPQSQTTLSPSGCGTTSF